MWRHVISTVNCKKRISAVRLHQKVCHALRIDPNTSVEDQNPIANDTTLDANLLSRLQKILDIWNECKENYVHDN